MVPQRILAHCDSGELWPRPSASPSTLDKAAAYQQALAVRALRLERDEAPRGFKIGFTNHHIWPKYNVDAPIWGVMWTSTVIDCDDGEIVSLDAICQPRLEPEVVFGMKKSPIEGATLEQLYDAIAWVAPGFEIVQSHLPEWKFTAADAIADGALHARLLIGDKRDVADIAHDADRFDAAMAALHVNLLRDGIAMEQGSGENVLGSPLRALRHFVEELRKCPGAPDLRAGDIVTTGTLTDAWPIEPAQQWTADFSSALGRLAVRFT